MAPERKNLLLIQISRIITIIENFLILIYPKTFKANGLEILEVAGSLTALRNAALFLLCFGFLSNPAFAYSYELTGPFYLDNTTATGPVVAGDFNGDGKADLVVVKVITFYILTQQSNGSLLQTSEHSTHQPKSINVGDINSDGKDDIVIVHSRGITSYIANSESGFTLKEVLLDEASTQIMGPSILIDLNRDGNLDLLALNSEGIHYFLNTGTELGQTKNFMIKPRASNGGRSNFAFGDLNSDGLVDFALASTFYGITKEARLEIFLQSQSGRFNAQIPIVFPGAIDISNLAIGDLNNDGLDDVVLTNSANFPNSVIHLFLQTDHTIAAYVSYQTDHIPASIIIEDMDGDGLNDMVTNHPGWDMAYTYLQKSPNFVIQTPVRGLNGNSGGDPYGLAAADFNSDGCRDLVVAGKGYYFLKGNDCVTNPIPKLSISGGNFGEGNSGARIATFRAFLSGSSSNSDTSFDIQTQSPRSIGNSAIPGSDYYALAKKRFTMPAGLNSMDINIKIIGDKTVEPDEIFSVAITNANGALVEKASATSTILNDDTASFLSIKPITNLGRNNDCNTLDARIDFLEKAVVTKKMDEKSAIMEILRTEKAQVSNNCKIKTLQFLRRN